MASEGVTVATNVVLPPYPIVAEDLSSEIPVTATELSVTVTLECALLD